MNELVIIEPPGEIWEKQNDETARNYSAFTVYMKLPPHRRSIAKAVKEQYGTSKESVCRVWQRWSSKYHWVARAAAWDDELVQQSRRDQVEAIKNMNDRTVKVAQAIQQKAIERLRSLDIAEMTPTQILQFMQIGTNLERIALGQPTEISQSSSTNANLNIDYSDLSEEQLRAILSKRIP